MTITSELVQFAQAITANFASRIPAQPEDQLKTPVANLLRDAGTVMGQSVAARTEALVAGLEGRPDIGVAVDGLLCGHVELKAPGKGARPERFRGADKAQWAKFKALPNLIYTDGNEWSLYRSGELQRVTRLTGDITTDGASVVTAENAEGIDQILASFFAWTPLVPASPKALAELLAPLCHLVRQDVIGAMHRSGSALDQLAHDWRTFLFPDADDNQFADAYAQTITYALLLARFSGARSLTTDAAVRALSHGHSLLAQALRILTDDQARNEIETGIDLLERAIGAVDVDVLTRNHPDPWLYFYEDFLAAYDPALRKDRGVYYTPAQVVGAQVRLVAELLETRFGKPLAFADDDVVLLDPATGTGTYPLAAMAEGLRRVDARFGEGARAGRATTLAANTHAFEILIGPYAVTHLRVSQEVIAAGGQLPVDGAHVYLTDTLESPHAEPPGQLTLLHRPLSDEHRRAQHVKADTRVLVCIGNPPYDRQQIEPGDMATLPKGGWVRHGEHGEGGVLEDFLAPARAAGAGVHLKNLYNDYVYFWRWALWKVFDSTQGAGVVSYITAASYLRGPGFVGMREVMRRTFDELWIIDLEGDNLGARKTENVFAIQTPVAIAVGVRYGQPNPDTPATVRYARLTGTKEEKLAALDAVRSTGDLQWRECPSGWHAPLLPVDEGDYFTWPLLTDVFPWQHSGSQFKRTWPIAEQQNLLRERWTRFMDALPADRPQVFKQSRDRNVDSTPVALPPRRGSLPPLRGLPRTTPPEEPVRYGFRSFDREWALPDARLGDFLRPSLWAAIGPRQVFLTSLLTGVLGLGPAASFTSHVPDLHHFRGSFGGKDVVPLWRDPSATDANVTSGLLELLSQALGRAVAPEDLFAYVCATLASPAYVEQFSEELTIPGPRIPITKDPELFQRGIELGRRLVWLHTYGERFVPEDETPGRVPQGVARNVIAVPGVPEAYPEAFSYEPTTRTLRVGDGAFAPVAHEVWEFSVSGLHVVRSWLNYRMKGGAGRTSSPLDEIRPERWTPQFTEELLELLWVLEATLAEYPALAGFLADVTRSEVFRADELPTPTDAERRAPAALGTEEVEQPGLGLDA